jgi:hypothetical protein
MTTKKSSLLIIGYYHLADGFRTCANYLQREYNVYFFPLCHYLDKKYDVQHELITYINGSKCDHYECGLQDNNPPIDIVLFWNFKYFIESHEGLNVLVYMKTDIKHKVIYLGYNWDPMPPVGDMGTLKLLFIRLLNAYLTCDGREIKYLKEKGEYNYVYCPPGFDPKVTYFIHDPSYICDISVVCTNLYTNYEIFPRQEVRVHRKELIDLLYEHRNELIFHIYGPPNFKDMYPECYRGYIGYEQCPKVFANSKINLCIHATSHNNYQHYLYFSERLPQIMGAHGLVYCETEYDSLLKPNINYILADANDPLAQIKSIIGNYQDAKYQLIKDAGHELALKFLTWDNMVEKINTITHREHKNKNSKNV